MYHIKTQIMIEPIHVQVARELCQEKGIDIYPVAVLWTHKIAIKRNGKEKLGNQTFLTENQYNNKGQLVRMGYEHKINLLWLLFAAKIKKRMINDPINLQTTNQTGQVAAGLPLLLFQPENAQLEGALIIFALLLALLLLIVVIAFTLATYLKNRNQE